MSRYLMTTAVILSMATPVLAAGSHSGGHGDVSQVDRVVEVSMRETDDGQMVFEPAEMTFEEGETVRLDITNSGELEHEFVLDTDE